MNYNFNPRTPDGVRRNQVKPLIKRSYFNPRTPDGVRQGLTAIWLSESIFQSTHP